jgi:hypothetical protein
VKILVPAPKHMNGLIFTGQQDHIATRNSGAYRIATSIRKEGIDVEVIDFFPYWAPTQLAELLKTRKNISWIGFSLTWMNHYDENYYNLFAIFTQYIRKEYPHIKLIGGGQNITTSNFSKHLDYVITGFGEKAFSLLLKYLYSNGIKPFGLKQGNCYVIDGNANYKSWPIKDLSINYEARDFIDPLESLTVEFSRGCKFACAFCNFPVLGVREDTTRDIDKFELELKRNFDLYGTTRYEVADETLNDRIEKLQKISGIVDRLDFDPNFNGYIRADILARKPEQYEHLIGARICAHQYGIETFNHKTGKTVGKGLHPDVMKETLIETKNKFIDALGIYRGTLSFVYGLPYETKDTIMDAQDWILENWSSESVTPYPLLLSDSSEGEIGYNTSKLLDNYEEYGYEIIDHQEPLEIDGFSSGIGKAVYWKNPNMELNEAISLSGNLNEKMKGTSRLTNWNVMNTMAKTIEESFEIVAYSDEHIKSIDKIVNHHRSYVEKKLSYK